MSAEDNSQRKHLHAGFTKKGFGFNWKQQPEESTHILDCKRRLLSLAKSNSQEKKCSHPGFTEKGFTEKGFGIDWKQQPEESTHILDCKERLLALAKNNSQEKKCSHPGLHKELARDNNQEKEQPGKSTYKLNEKKCY